ncbi:MAG: shikimate dehydrogenase [Bacteroidota bacterium]
MRQFGLIGDKLGHSFSKGYFSEKFQGEGIAARYDLFELASIDEFPDLVRRIQPTGLNVTLPYKEAVIPFLDDLSPAAKTIGAVNTIHFQDGKSTGHNTDIYGFRISLEESSGGRQFEKALILGTGGAAKAVQYVLATDCGIEEILFASRQPQEVSQLAYQELDADFFNECFLIVNTTPLGMAPQTDAAPDIPYQFLTDQHLAFDLIYNPAETQFMKLAGQQAAQTINGLQMLHLQAEKAWDIWNSDAS